MSPIQDKVRKSPKCWPPRSVLFFTPRATRRKFRLVRRFGYLLNLTPLLRALAVRVPCARVAALGGCGVIR